MLIFTKENKVKCSCGTELNSGDTDNMCYKCRTIKQVIPVYNPGWVCPKCSAVYGPSVSECRRCNGSSFEITYGTGEFKFNTDAVATKEIE